jgi:hypothetical protein
MSALGQKRTFALQQAMSALLPIATAKADIRWWIIEARVQGPLGPRAMPYKLRRGQRSRLTAALDWRMSPVPRSESSAGRPALFVGRGKPRPPYCPGLTRLPIVVLDQLRPGNA